MNVRRWVAVTVAAGCLVAAAGCGSSAGDDSSRGEPTEVSPAFDPGPDSGSSVGEESARRSSGAGNDSVAATGGGSVDSAAVTGTESPSQSVDPVAASPAAIGRSVVSTAMVTVESDNVIEARQRTAAIASAAGGAIYDEETEIGETGRTTLTLKVPPDQFQSVLTQLGQVGKLTSQGISTEDVTSQVVDLDARIASAEASVARMRALMAQATSVSEVAALENELASRETSLEMLRGQQRTLDARVDLATVVLTVVPPPVVIPPPVAEEPTSVPTFGEALANGWDVVVATLTVLAAAVGWALPFVPFVVVLVVGVRWFRHRYPSSSTPPVRPGDLPSS